MAEKVLYGVMAEFDQPGALLEAVRRTRAAGYTAIDAFSPMPVHGLDDAMDIEDRRLPLIVLLGGIIGGLSGFGLMYWITNIAYPLNVGGRPLYSWPSYIPPTFETTILFAALTAVFGMIALNGLPMPYHPVFNVPQFEHASRNHFFLLIESRDSKFDYMTARGFLEGLSPLSVAEVIA